MVEARRATRGGADIRNASVLVLNDQGGAVMDVSYDVAATLRAQDHGHPPLIFDARGNRGGGISPTITGDHQSRITDYTAIVIQTNEETVQQSKE